MRTRNKPLSWQRAPAVLLWAESAVCLVPVFVYHLHWLLPVCGLLALFAALLNRLPWLGIVTALGASVAWGWFSYFGMASSTPGFSTATTVAFLIFGAILSFLVILSTTQNTEQLVPRCLLRLAVLFHFIVAGIQLGGAYTGAAWHTWMAAALAFISTVLALDTALKLLARMYTPRRHWQAIAEPGAFFFYRWWPADWRACLPADAEKDELDNAFSLRLGDMWMWPVVRSSLPLLGVFSAVILWLGTCLHEVPAGSQGVRQVLGSWQAEPLAPGLHTSPPWPMGTVQIVETQTVREVVLGFKTDPGRPILWERAHYEGEQQSLVGGGDDFLSISVPVLYTVSDPWRYLRSSATPESLLVAEANRVLLALTLRRPAAEIMTVSRESIRREFRDRLKTAVDDLNLGIEIAEVYLRDIHPPVEVAPAFQEVVAAMEDKEAYVHEAEAYQRDTSQGADGAAKATLITAQASAANRAAQVRGQTARFTSLHEAWARNPTLYQWREGFRVFDEALGNTKKVVLDDRLPKTMPIHLDMRKVLNPDLVDSAPPAPQTLIPRPLKALDAFDLEIEGYLRSGRGDIPAVNATANDADNLLTAPAPAPPQKP